MPNTTTNTNADLENQGTIRMWPSEQLASRLYDWANWGLIVGLVIGVVSTIFLVWMGNVKEAHLKMHLADASTTAAQANERSGHLENDNLRLSGSIAVLQQSASDAKSAQQTVELELERQREKTARAQEELLAIAKRQAGRFILKGSLSTELKGKTTGTITIWYQPDDTEAYMFASSLGYELADAGWKVVPPVPVPIPSTASMSSFRPPEFQSKGLEQFEQLMPLSYRGGGGSAELSVLSRSHDKEHPDEALTALEGALKPLTPSFGWRIAETLPQGAFILIVGAKR